ncbi:MAG: U32 family peptidase, partial [Anaerolineae bacterium]|nr:U32 family peptidase [Anaerolineae bacterium]
RAVLEEAEKQQVLIHRVSQGSGIMLMTDAEIREMVKLGAEAGIEVSLFVGPRAAWDTGAQITASAGKNLGARLRGMDQVVYAVEDIKRANALGIRSVLVADEGLMWLVLEMKKAGELPADFVVKVSVQMGAANPISVRMMEQLGAGTYNTPTDLSLPQLAAIRQAIHIPLDIYVEVPDDFGGFVRHYEVPEMIRVAAPMYVKLGLRNSPNIYPSGVHVEPTAIALSRERVHRAAIALDMIRRYYPEATTSKRGAPDLGIPVV